MVSCEMCGAHTSQLSKVIVAGSEMNLCSNCKVHGREKNESPTSKFFYKRKKEEEPNLEVVENASNIIKQALAKRGLDSQHLARAVSIKEGEINKYLSGKLQLTIPIAQRIEKFLEIKLIQEVDDSNTSSYIADGDDEEDNSPLTLGEQILKQLKEKNK